MYGGKVSYSAYDPIITYWREAGGAGNVNAVRAILQGKLSQHMTDVEDLLARNAMLSVPFTYFPNNKSSFAQLSARDTMTTSILNAIHLGMANRDVPYTQDVNGAMANIVCVTSPGVLFDLQQQTDPKDWLVPMAYSDNATRLLNYEVGTYRNVRFVVSPKSVLFNCGTIIVQDPVTSAIHAGDGGPNYNVSTSNGLLQKADSTYLVGQPGATGYIQLTASAGDIAQYAVGDRVTVHTQRTNAYGVTNGVDFTDGTVHNRRIIAVDTTNKRLQFNEPIMIDMTTDLGGGTYAYVTKGVHVNASIFIGGNEGVVLGIGRPPRMHAPPPIDDFDHIYRFSWDSYQGYNLYRPEVIEVVFSAASYRETGNFALQG